MRSIPILSHTKRNIHRFVRFVHRLASSCCLSDTKSPLRTLAHPHRRTLTNCEFHLCMRFNLFDVVKVNRKCFSPYCLVVAFLLVTYGGESGEQQSMRYRSYCFLLFCFLLFFFFVFRFTLSLLCHIHRRRDMVQSTG